MNLEIVAVAGMVVSLSALFLLAWWELRTQGTQGTQGTGNGDAPNDAHIPPAPQTNFHGHEAVGNNKTTKGKISMHFKNGREAQNGDPVVGINPYTRQALVGNITDLNPGATSCNCTVVRGFGSDLSCQTVGELYHAEDAFLRAELVQSTPPAAAPDFTPAPPPISASDIPSAPEEAPAPPAMAEEKVTY